MTSQHGLAGFGEAIGPFAVDDRPAFVETVDEGPGLIIWHALIMVATHAEVAVADGKDRLSLRHEPRIELGLDDLPFVDRVDMTGEV